MNNVKKLAFTLKCFKSVNTEFLRGNRDKCPFVPRDNIRAPPSDTTPGRQSPTGVDVICRKAVPSDLVKAVSVPETESPHCKHCAWRTWMILSFIE